MSHGGDYSMIPASTPNMMFMFLSCFECLGNCIGLALQSKGLAGWLTVWLASWPDGWLAGRLSSWSGNGLEVLSGRAGPCPAGTALRAHACLAATWRPSKHIDFEINRTAANEIQNGKLLAGAQKCSQKLDLDRFCKGSRTASKI